MSEFLADALVLVRPDTTAFRADLLAQLTAATRGVTVPVPVVASSGGLAATQGLLLANRGLKQSVDDVGKAQKAGAESAKRATSAQREAARAAAEHAKRLAELRSGALATSATLTGLRGSAIGASGPFIAAAAAVTIAFKSLQAFTTLERELKVFQVTAGATADEMSRVSDESTRLGRDIDLPGVAAGDAAQAMSLLARAGLDVEDAIGGARGTLLLATAAQVDNAAAAELAANSLNAFGLAGDRAESVADLLAGAANAAQGSLLDMGLALQQSASVARLVGISLEDTVALLTLLARNGLQASDAGTSLRTALLRLADPRSKEAAALLEELNLQIRDVEGNIRPEVFGELGIALSDLSAKQRDATLSIIFGQDAIRSSAILAREGASGLNEMRDATDQQGAAAELAGARVTGFNRNVENLTSNLETLGTTIGRVTAAILNPFVFGIGAVVGGINSAIDAVSNAVAPTFEFGETTEELGDQLNAATEKLRVYSDAFGPDVVSPRLKERVDALGDALTSTLPKALQRSAEGAAALTQSLEEAADAADKLGGAASRLSAQEVLGRIAGFEEELLDVRLGDGSRAEEIAVLRKEEAALQKRLDAGGLTVEGRRKLKAELFRVQQEIAGIEQEIANDRKSAADEQQRIRDQAARDAEQRARDEVQKIRDSIDVREGQIRNRLALAAETETIKDDLRFLTQLRALFRRALGNKKLELAERLSFRNQEQAISAQIRALRESVAEDRRREQAEILKLNIEIAQVTGNRGAEERALEAQIGFLQRQINNTRRGSVERKRLILEQRRAQQELKELKDEVKKTDRGFADMAFEFLQQQQGFAANLLGNLIPTGASGGLVAGSQQPMSIEAPVQSAQAQAAAEMVAGPTRGQIATEVDVLKEMLEVLKSIQRGNAHPEATRQRKNQGGSMDTLTL